MVKRRDVLRAASAVAPAAAAWGAGIRPAAAAAGPAAHPPMNIILFITDQERAEQHFPPGWSERNLPGLTALKRHGLSFNKAFCPSCMCSPSRTSLFTGLFPAQHEVKDTLTFGTDYSHLEQVMPRNITNLARVMHGIGYDVVYKGKWHVSKPLSDPQSEEDALKAWRPHDLAIYGFHRWAPPDAGENQDLDQFGGGYANHDARYMTGDTHRRAEQEGALDYLQHVAGRDRPFFMVISLVNPHDVLSYPKTWRDGGYHSHKWLEGEIGLPATWNESLATKPTAQAQLVATLAVSLGVLGTRERRLAYLNFYANLIRRSDAYVARTLELLKQRDLLQSTLIIRTADHGEMGLAHGGLRQKNFNFYEETMRVPLVYSNPVLYPKPVTTDAMVSHVDFLPTMASYLGAEPSPLWRGVDYSAVLRDPEAKGPQANVLFTFDDIRAGQNTAAVVLPPNRIVAIREARYKLARYYDGDGVAPDQWEMYDLLKDPLETTNLAYDGYDPTPEQTAARERMTAELKKAEKHRLKPLPFDVEPKPDAPQADPPRAG